MKIAVINETSTGDRNSDIIKALDGFGHDVINAGMTNSGMDPQLTYIETGFLAAILLNTGRADLVIGGCGTGQGFINSAMQYPGVFCGLIQSPLDAWLFRQINGGNCISLALGKGYGWGADADLKFIFEKLFSVEPGCGYPQHRKESQKKSRMMLADISSKTHIPFYDIVKEIDRDMINRVLSYPAVWELLKVESIEELMESFA